MSDDTGCAGDEDHVAPHRRARKRWTLRAVLGRVVVGRDLAGVLDLLAWFARCEEVRDQAAAGHAHRARGRQVDIVVIAGGNERIVTPGAEELIPLAGLDLVDASD